MSQAELAEESKLSQTYISQIETGVASGVTVVYCAALFDVLDQVMEITCRPKHPRNEMDHHVHSIILDLRNVIIEMEREFDIKRWQSHIDGIQAIINNIQTEWKPDTSVTLGDPHGLS